MPVPENDDDYSKEVAAYFAQVRALRKSVAE
jgi:hypothetical protein